jgi:hypothetical protein
MSTQDSPKPVAWLMVNPTHPRLTPSVTLTPETGWHITWKSCPLYDQAAIDAAVAVERERWHPAAEKARAALADLLMTRDPLVYSDALRALDEALGPNVRANLDPTAEVKHD